MFTTFTSPAKNFAPVKKQTFRWTKKMHSNVE